MNSDSPTFSLSYAAKLLTDDLGRPYLELAAEDGHATDDHATDAHASGEHASDAHATDEHGADAHAEGGHGAEAHGDGHDAHAHEGHGHDDHAHAPSKDYRFPQEFPNIYTLLKSYGETHHHAHHGKLGGPFAVHPPVWLNGAFALFYGLVFVIVIRRIVRFWSIEKPGRAQVAVETLFGGLYDFFEGILGKDYVRKFVPFAGSMWIFILLCNLSGLVPLLKSPTAHFWTAAGLAGFTFIYVQIVTIRESGPWHVFHHLCGSPDSAIAWVFAPLIFCLELLGTFVKPLSLALRLSGNIFGEDKLLVAFLTFGMLIPSIAFGTPTPLVGLPLHAPIIVLCVLFSTIQATVFSLLSAVYIALLLPHEHHHDEHGHDDHGHGHADGAHHGPGGAHAAHA